MLEKGKTCHKNYRVCKGRQGKMEKMCEHDWKIVSLSEQNQEKSTVSTAQCKEKRQEMDLLRIYQKVPISQMTLRARIACL